MTKLEVIKNGLHALMIDGYAPVTQSLKNAIVKSHEIMHKPLSYLKSDFQHYYRKKELISENLNLSFFKALVSHLRSIYCPYITGDGRRDGRCTYRFFSIKPNMFSLETFLNHGPKCEKKGLEDVLPILQNEFDNDRLQGKLKYTQNLIFYTNCDSIDECCIKWIKELNFKIKKSDEYVNLPAFKKAWSTLLGHELNHYSEQPNKYRPKWVQMQRSS